MSLTPQQLARRAGRVTGSVVSEILFGDRALAYRRIVEGHSEPLPKDPVKLVRDRRYLGGLDEPRCLALARILRPDHKIKANKHVFYRRGVDWAACTPDAIVLEGARRVGIGEWKNVDKDFAYQFSLPEEEPVLIRPEQLVQCLWNMWVTDLPVCLLGVMIGGNDFRLYEIEQDSAMMDKIVRKCFVFYTDHVVPRKPPVTGSKHSYDALAIEIPEPVTVAGDAQDAKHIRRLIRASNAMSRLKEIQTECKSVLIERYPTAKRIVTASGYSVRSRFTKKEYTVKSHEEDQMRIYPLKEKANG